jgi:hypothetical protein
MAKTQVSGNQILDLTVTDADVAAANKDGVAGTASMRTLGTGAQQAAAGNHTHAHSALTSLTTGDDHTQYANLNGRSLGQLIYGGTGINTGLSLAGNPSGGDDYVDTQSGVCFSGRITPAQITADQNDYNPASLMAVFTLRLSTDASRNITGLTAPSISASGRLLHIQNVGSFNIVLKHESTSSLVANRFHFSSSADITIPAGCNLLLYYDNQSGVTRWKDFAGNTAPSPHSGLTGLTIGDDHTQYALLAGRAGGQTFFGGTATHNTLTLRGSSTGDGNVLVSDGFSLQRTTPASLAADQNDYTGIADTSSPVIRLNPTTANRTITGISATNLSLRCYCLINISTTLDVILSHESASSTAANRFNFPNERDYVLRPNGSLMIWYDASSSRWRQMNDSGTQRALPTLYRQGLVWKRNDATSTTNDVNVGAGSCRDATDTYDIIINSAITKSLAGTWVVGSGSNGLDAGTRANNTWYYIWAIARSDTGVCDILLSTSSTAPTMPTSYDKKRLIGAIRTGASLLSQVYVRGGGSGDLFVHYLDPATNGVDATTTTLSTTRTDFTLSYIPPIGAAGDEIQGLFNAVYNNAGAGNGVYITNPNMVDSAPSEATNLVELKTSVANIAVEQRLMLLVDHAAKVSARATAASSTFRLLTMGYYWPGYF